MGPSSINWRGTGTGGDEETNSKCTVGLATLRGHMSSSLYTSLGLYVLQPL